ncbi:hypothetical protein [Qipengyuania sp. RANM35]|uniref:hypothetical protein n=1 Tax=Qipengyuania sp. RANM35 TaxID=3068635 RepID=UPI0034DB32D6
MTKTDLSDAPGEVVPGSARYWRNLLLWAVGLGLFLPFAILPIILARKADGPLDWLVIAAIVIASIFVGRIFWRTAPDFTMGEPRTARGIRMRWILVGIALLGPLAGYPLIAHRGPNGERLDLFSNAALPGSVVLPMLAVWCIAIPLLIFLVRRNSDDFMRSANDFGFMVGGQLFYFVAPVWWLAWRGGFLPRPDVMILFIVTLVGVNLANLWKRQHG